MPADPPAVALAHAFDFFRDMCQIRLGEPALTQERRLNLRPPIEIVLVISLSGGAHG